MESSTPIIQPTALLTKSKQNKTINIQENIEFISDNDSLSWLSGLLQQKITQKELVSGVPFLQVIFL